MGLGSIAPVLIPEAHMGSLWPGLPGAGIFSWQMFQIWYLQHPGVSTTVRLHLHSFTHNLPRGCLQGIWPRVVCIALLHRPLSGNSMQAFMTPVTACLQNQHHVDSTKLCWQLGGSQAPFLSWLQWVTQSIITFPYTALFQQGPQELFLFRSLFFRHLGGISPTTLSLLSQCSVFVFSLVMLISVRIINDVNHSHSPLFYAWTTIVHSQMIRDKS